MEKLKAYVLSQFNHFAKVTGLPVHVIFETSPEEYMESFELNINVEIGGLELKSKSRKRHTRRLNHLCQKLEERYDVYTIVTNTKPRPLTPEQQTFRDATTHNRASIEQSKWCGCYYCENIFPATDITDDNYCDQGTTACCPICDMDTVYGDASGIAVTPEHLLKLHRKWFKD